MNAKMHRSRGFPSIRGGSSRGPALLISAKSLSCRRGANLPKVGTSKGSTFDSRSGVMSSFKRQTPSYSGIKSASFEASRRPSTAPLEKVLPKDGLPKSPCISQHTRRVFWNKRPGLSELLVIVFEGVLGDCYRPNVWSQEDPSIKLREGIKVGLEELSKSMHIVLLLTYSASKNTQILQQLKHKRIQIDAAYKRRGSDFKFRQVYDQIADDFNVKEGVNWNLLTVSTKEIAFGEELYEEHTTSHKRYSLMYAPVQNDRGNLMVMMVPHLRLNRNLNFNLIAQQVRKRIRHDDNTLFRDFWVPMKLLDSCPMIVPFVQWGEQLSCFYVLVRSQRPVNEFPKPPIASASKL